jgi:hypothetical protein
MAALMTVNGPTTESKHSEAVALDDLIEVEACLRDLLQSTSDPAILQRLFNLHREIQKYISELTPKSR